jgi:hypothetical protein
MMCHIPQVLVPCTQASPGQQGALAGMVLLAGVWLSPV